MNLALTSREGRFNQSKLYNDLFSPMGILLVLDIYGFPICIIFAPTLAARDRCTEEHYQWGARGLYSQHHRRLAQRRMDCACEVAPGRPKTRALTTKVDRKRQERRQKGRLRANGREGTVFKKKKKKKKKKKPPPLIQVFT